MVTFRDAVDEKIAADLLWQVKAIATKEFESLPEGTQQAFFLDVSSTSTSEAEESRWIRRSRTVSVESIEMASRRDPVSPLLMRSTISLFNQEGAGLASPLRGSAPHHIEHFDWSKHASSSEDSSLEQESLLPAELILSSHKFGKRKRESYVGQNSKAGVVRATLRKKFSWKQYPELEEFLVTNQDEYFEFSSKNYTAEQRKYNNGLTRGLLDLASEEGYVFEEFTFSMVRDRIRCYYKSHSQSAKKKRRR